ncbi:MAG: hypothetical protein IT167_19980 [Bryobacterales bacterium]|nr:hypothetical protein [Bryobacterales bacterium]
MAFAARDEFLILEQQFSIQTEEPVCLDAEIGKFYRVATWRAEQGQHSGCGRSSALSAEKVRRASKTTFLSMMISWVVVTGSAGSSTG